MEFEISKRIPDDVLSIKFKNKFVHLPFTDHEENLNLIEFKDRILNPCISAIERKIKNA